MRFNGDANSLTENRKTEVKDLLEGAKSVLNEHGWTRGSYYNRNTGCYCADGALMRADGPRVSSTGASGLSDVYWEAWYFTNMVAGKITEGATHSFIEYNDKIASNKEDVLNLFDRTIEELS